MALPRRRKHLSLILYKDQVVAVGDSLYKSHPISVELGYKDFMSLHSEASAFTRIPKHIRYYSTDLTLINMRFNRYGESRNSRPCEVCMKWCCELFDDIFFTTNDGIEYLRC